MKLSLIDKAILGIDAIVRGPQADNNYPARSVQDSTAFTQEQKQKSISMMRINHSGEICAQALYHGQALMARSTHQYQSLMHAAAEENSHLSWCNQRLQELQARPSLLSPVWYAGSFAIGVLAGSAGDQISLGFLAETEYQVTAHLEKHLHALSPHDQRSRSILIQMRRDELEHATKAMADGGVRLPRLIRFAMRCSAKVMTTTAGRI